MLACKELWTNDEPQLPRRLRELRQHHLRAQAGAEAAADLGRRRERPGAAPHRASSAMAGTRSAPTHPSRWTAWRATGPGSQAAWAAEGGRARPGRGGAGLSGAEIRRRRSPPRPAMASAGCSPAARPRSPATCATCEALGVAAIDFSFPGATTADALDCDEILPRHRSGEGLTAMKLGITIAHDPRRQAAARAWTSCWRPNGSATTRSGRGEA